MSRPGTGSRGCRRREPPGNSSLWPSILAARPRVSRGLPTIPRASSAPSCALASRPATAISRAWTPSVSTRSWRSIAPGSSSLRPPSSETLATHSAPPSRARLPRCRKSSLRRRRSAAISRPPRGDCCWRSVSSASPRRPRSSLPPRQRGPPRWKPRCSQPPLLTQRLPAPRPGLLVQTKLPHSMEPIPLQARSCRPRRWTPISRCPAARRSSPAQRSTRRLRRRCPERARR
mmetsp:Transcript_13106/g.37695  ORF Transcript_13106/g.37695 Transcript_13106/m.37695 type:complete len:232 (+) Transcript_13106:249-944(+)